MITPSRISTLVCGLVAVLTGPAFGQNTLRERLRDQQLGDRWIYDDWEEARTLAGKEGKPIFVVFR